MSILGFAFVGRWGAAHRKRRLRSGNVRFNIGVRIAGLIQYIFALNKIEMPWIRNDHHCLHISTAKEFLFISRGRRTMLILRYHFLQKDHNISRSILPANPLSSLSNATTNTWYFNPRHHATASSPKLFADAHLGNPCFVEYNYDHYYHPLDAKSLISFEREGDQSSFIKYNFYAGTCRQGQSPPNIPFASLY